MRRTMTGFHQDEAGDWVAELSCLHGQHVRHRPPFWEAAWVISVAGRDARVGQLLDCPLCDRTELPDGLRSVRTTATWDENTVPGALLRAHRVAPGTWGLLEVQRGELRFLAETEPRLEVVVTPSQPQPIPPEVEHRVELTGPVRFRVSFLAR